MQIEICQINTKECDALFQAQTGSRISITSKSVVVDSVSNRKEMNGPVTYYATATDVFIKMNGEVKRLFVDISIDLGTGLKHIWLTDGPAV